jgi:hypothetical protein
MMSARRMGKIEDMRRLREQQFAAANDDKGAAKKSSAATVSAPGPSATAATKASTTDTRASASSSKAEEGKCPTCGKLKPLTNGLLANHQKGFGKACAGSRKEPA